MHIVMILYHYHKLLGIFVTMVLVFLLAGCVCVCVCLPDCVSLCKCARKETDRIIWQKLFLEKYKLKQMPTMSVTVFQKSTAHPLCQPMMWYAFKLINLLQDRSDKFMAELRTLIWCFLNACQYFRKVIERACFSLSEKMA